MNTSYLAASTNGAPNSSSPDLSAMGAQVFMSMKQQYSIHPSRLINQYVQCISQAITDHVPASVYSGTWEVVVFDDPKINAFALPGGKIGVYTGLLNVVKNQDQLATVIGHEVAHVIEEHSKERLEQDKLIGFGQQAASILLQAKGVNHSASIMSALGLGLQYGVALPYSRAHEKEADMLGLELMARAGFNPEQAIDLWQNMERANRRKPPEFMSSHPASSTRILHLKADMADARALYDSVLIKPDCD